MRILYLSATGSADPTRASLAFHLAANGSAAAGQDAVLVLAGDATDLLRPGVADGLAGVGVPPMGELVAKVREAGVEVHV